MVKSTERVCYYETLRLEPNCSREDIKMAYYNPISEPSLTPTAGPMLSQRFSNPDLEVPFHSINFNGYSNSGRGFYKVYSDVFNMIYANERAFQKRKKLPWNSVHKPP
ncbi:hypothetical protein M0R45_024606 [Rubus argutus]|uniref:Uncharacterized protein n=1 Tax=Rubus argutus TaxID=59490 RepID=A0AAW1WT71_RUBAR